MADKEDTLNNRLAEAVAFEPEVIKDRDQLRAPILIALYDYWNKLRGDRFAPSRSDIHPADIASLLPHIVIFEALDGGQRCRVRLAGSAIAQHFTESLARTIQEDSSERIVDRRNLSLVRTIMKERAPYFCFWDTSKIDHFDYLSSEMIWLPLSSDGKNVDQVLSSFWMVPKRRVKVPGFDD